VDENNKEKLQDVKLEVQIKIPIQTAADVAAFWHARLANCTVPVRVPERVPGEGPRQEFKEVSMCVHRAPLHTLFDHVCSLCQEGCPCFHPGPTARIRPEEILHVSLIGPDCFREAMQQAADNFHATPNCQIRLCPTVSKGQRFCVTPRHFWLGTNTSVKASCLAI
jgi:hypothetical protein